MAATLLLPAFVLALRLLGLRPSLALLPPTTRKGPGPWDAQAAVERAERIALLTDVAARRTSPLFADCLPRSLALCWLCRWERLPARVQLGVRTLTGRFEAHAWVEVGGTPIGEDEDVRAIYETMGPLRVGGAGTPR